MTMQIPMDQPLSDEHRAYLLMRGDDARVVWFDQTYPAVVASAEDEDDDEEAVDYETWTVPTLTAEIERRNKAGSQISPASTKKADLVAALEADDEDDE